MWHRRAVLRALTAWLAVPSLDVGRAEQARFREELWSNEGLYGTLVLPPRAEQARPAVLLLAGSGPSPRDGTFGTQRQIAEGLAGAGIASLRYDKRGVGASRFSVLREEDLTIQLYAEDAVKAARNLGARRDVSSVFIVGHSEGALLATMAAEKTPVGGIALLAGIGRNLAGVIREQLTKLPMPQDLRAEALQILESLRAGHAVPLVRPELALLFRPSVQPFLISSFAIDPAEALKRVSAPVLLVRAGRDLQVPEKDFAILRSARPDAPAVVLEEANHVFKPAPADLADREAQNRSYDPVAPLVPGLVPTLVEFIRRFR